MQRVLAPKSDREIVEPSSYSNWIPARDLVTVTECYGTLANLISTSDGGKQFRVLKRMEEPRILVWESLAGSTSRRSPVPTYSLYDVEYPSEIVWSSY